MIKERLRNETIDNISDDLKELKKKDNIEILEADEIMTYVKKNLKIKDKISGYGYLLIETAIKLLTLKQVKEIERHIIKYLIENK